MNGAESVSLSARGSSGVADDAARLWWVFVAIGSMWVIFGLLVFRIDATTVSGLAILFGAVALAGALVELFAGFTNRGGWRIAHLLFAFALAVVGILCFVHPGDSFATLATIFAFYLFLRGVMELLTSLLLHGMPLWWIGLVTGTAQILLAFWAAGDFGHKAFLFVVWVGATAMLTGVRQIVLGFEVRAR